MKITQELLDSITAHKDLSIPMLPMYHIIEVMNELGYKEKKPPETHGWECEFWVEFVKKDHPPLELIGSWYYGGYIFRKA